MYYTWTINIAQLTLFTVRQPMPTYFVDTLVLLFQEKFAP